MSFFFNDTATTEIYTLSLHDALPIFDVAHGGRGAEQQQGAGGQRGDDVPRQPGGGHRRLRVEHGVDGRTGSRSEEHTSELQSRQYLVCRLLLEKKKTTRYYGDHLHII